MRVTRVRPWISLVVCATAFTPSTKQELQTAVDSWCADSAAAEATYGPIKSWDTSLIADMSSLFREKTTCNPDISLWNTTAVTTMR